MAVFSARNAQLPLHNCPRASRVGLLNMEMHALFKQASVVESMLVALNHMQVNVCTFGGRQDSRAGLTPFRTDKWPEVTKGVHCRFDFTRWTKKK